MTGNPPSVLTSQYDNCRDGYNRAETILTPSNVSSLTQASFSPLQVDSAASVLPSQAPSNPIYAQPLYLAGVSLKNVSTVNHAACNPCNVLVAVTLNDTVFAWNADTGAILWTIQAGTVGSGSPNWITQAPLFHDCGTTNVGPVTGQYTNLPFAGVLSTPVIDVSGTTPYMFLVSECTTPSPRSNAFYLHKIDLTQGIDTQPAVQILPSASGADQPDDWANGAVQFNGVWELQRPALLEVFVPGNPAYSPLIYVAFGVGIQETTQPYQGWVVGFDTSLNQQFAFVTDPTGNTANLTPPCCQNCTACSTDTSTCCQPGTCQLGQTPCCNTNCVPYMPGTTTYFQNSPNWCGHGGGIWMSGRGGAANNLNGTSYAFFGTGNGGFTLPQPNIPQNYGESLINFQLPANQISSLLPAKFFAPYGNPKLAPSVTGSACPNESGACRYTVELYNENDWDSASSGVVLFNDAVPNVTYVLTVDKAGYGHLLNETASWQGFQTGDPDDHPFGAAQTLCMGTAAECDRVTSLAFDSDGEVAYLWPNREKLTALPFAAPSAATGTGTISQTPGSTTVTGAGTSFLNNVIAGDMILAAGQSRTVTAVASQASLTVNQPFSPALTGNAYQFQGYFVNPQFDQNPPSSGYPGGSVLVTSNSGTNAIVWALAPLHGSFQGMQSQGVLYAYNSYAAGLGQLWNSTQIPGMTKFCDSTFSLPTIVNGSAYMPTYAITTASTCGIKSTNPPAASGVLVLCGPGSSACSH